MRKGLAFITLAILAIMLTGLPNFSSNAQSVSAQSNFNDDFNTTTLNSSYSVIDPSGNSTFSLTASPGYLRINASAPPDRDLWKSVNYNAPRIERQGIIGNFTVETKVLASPARDWECCGIYIWQSENNFLRFERASGNTILLGVTKDGTATPNYLYNVNFNSTYLKIIRSGDLFSTFYSKDGTDWINAWNITFPISITVAIGLDAVIVYHTGVFYADFDYLKIQDTNTQPISNENYFFKDDFNLATLNSRWTTFDLSGGSTLSLIANSGWARISTVTPPDRDLGPTVNTAPRLITSPIYGNFVIDSKISANMTDNDEGGGILLWKDSNHFVRFERICRHSMDRERQQQIILVGPNEVKFTTLASNWNPTFLKLIRTGNVFAGYASPNGVEWQHFGNITIEIDEPIQTGLTIVQTYHAGTFYADFDYFEISSNIPQSLPAYIQPTPTIPQMSINPTTSPISPSLEPTAPQSPVIEPTQSPTQTQNANPISTSTIAPTTLLPTSQPTQTATLNLLQSDALIWLLPIAVPSSVIGLWLLYRTLRFDERKTKIADLIEKDGKITLKEMSKNTGIKEPKMKKAILEATKEKQALQGFFIDNDKGFISKATMANSLNALGKFSFNEVSKKFNITEFEALNIVTVLHKEAKIKGTFTADQNGFITEDRLLDEIGKD